MSAAQPHPATGTPRAAHEPSAFERTDYWRRSPARVGGRAGHKEWSYFCVFAEQLDVLVNFSLMDATSGRGTSLDVPRLAVLVREGGDCWEGDVEQFAPSDVHAPPGHGDARFGANTLALDAGGYRIEARLRRRPVAVSLRLRPFVAPAVASSVKLSERGAMRWLVVPRLLASGTVEVGGRRHELDSCLAYHDRNWGYFDWGADFSWEWAAILPDDAAVPWSLVYMRIGDRSRNRTYSQSVIVWRGDAPAKTFHGRDIEVRERGLQRHAAVLRIPRVMSLASPGNAADVPESVSVAAAAGEDRLDIALRFAGLAQIGMPNDGRPGLTLLSETGGAARVTGRLRGESVDFTGRVLAELNHAAA